YAVPPGWHAGGDRPQPARRSVTNERRSDPRNAPRMGGALARSLLLDAGVRRRDRVGDQGAAQGRWPAGRRQDPALRRNDRRAVRAARLRRLYLHAEALAPRG